jgi:hypothetical protein
MQKILLLAVGIFGLFACNANAAVITFDGAVATTPLTFGAFQFSSTGGSAGTVAIGNVHGATGSNGTHAFGFTAGATVTVSYTGLGTFTLNSLDLAPLGGVVPTPTTFTIGGNVFGPIGTLAPTSFGATFSNLTSLVFNATADSAFDNFDFTINAPSAVPEPASAAFLGLGSLALVVRRLRRRTSVVA